MTNGSTSTGECDCLAKWRTVAATATSVGPAKRVVLVAGQPQLCVWSPTLLNLLGRANSSSIVRMLLEEISANFDGYIADEAARIFHLQSRPLTNSVLRSLLDWLDHVRVTRTIQVPLSKFDRMVAQLARCAQLKLCEDHYNLLFGHVVACQTKAPDQFTQAVAEKALADALVQIRATAQRLQDQLALPDSMAFRRIFATALAQHSQLEIVGSSSAKLRSQVAAMAREQLAERPLLTRHQVIATVTKLLVQIASAGGGVRLRPMAHARPPLPKLIKLTQLSPDQLPD